MSDLGWNIWGVVGGVIGTILAVVPLFLVWLRVRLPSKKLPSLLAVLEETKELFAKAVRAGALTDAQEIQQIEFSIATYVCSRVFSSRVMKPKVSQRVRTRGRISRDGLRGDVVLAKCQKLVERSLVQNGGLVRSAECRPCPAGRE